MQCDHCGAEVDVGEGVCFCSNCGHEFKVSKNIIFCQGRKRDGTKCKAVIKKKSQYCGKCGNKVGPDQFVSVVVTCQGQRDGDICGNILEEEDEFCTMCGTFRPAEITENVAKEAKEDNVHANKLKKVVVQKGLGEKKKAAYNPEMSRVEGIIQTPALHIEQLQKKINKTNDIQTVGKEAQEESAVDEMQNETGVTGTEMQDTQVELREKREANDVLEMTKVAGIKQAAVLQKEPLKEDINKTEVVQEAVATSQLENKKKRTEKEEKGTFILEHDETSDNALINETIHEGWHKDESSKYGESLVNQDTVIGNTHITIPGDHDYITFHFNVLLTPDFKLKPDKDRVFIVINGADFEECTGDKVQMHHVRTVGKHEEMHATVELPKWLVFESGFYYKYAIFKELIDKPDCEYYYNKSSKSYCRHCYLSDKLKAKSEYHQYDGVMYPNTCKQELYKKGDPVKMLERDAEISAEVFISAGLMPTENRAAMLNPGTHAKLEFILSGLEKRYVQHAECWSSKEGFMQQMAEIILLPILKSLESEQGKPLAGYSETEQEGDRRMQMALYALIVARSLKFTLSPNNKSLLAKSLLLRPHHETGQQDDLAFIEKLSQDEKK